MVGLPSIESREMILRTLLSNEKTDDLDFHEIGQKTEGYTGSDLKVYIFFNLKNLVSNPWILETDWLFNICETEHVHHSCV